jgi:molybdopterin converting factor small subunit
MTIRIVFTGRGYDASASLPREIQLSAGGTTADAVEEVRRLLQGKRGLSPSCLVVVQGRHLGTVGRHAAQELRDGDELLLIAPVAGG